MPIKLSVPFHQKDRAKELGAWWVSDVKTWIIPDTIDDINPFLRWLPEKEGFIVKRPYLIAKSHRNCWKCRLETPLIALGAKSFYALAYETEDNPIWTKWEYPILFSEIDFLDEEIIEALQNTYPFFQYTYSNTAKQKYWANTCIHCQSLQGDNYNFMEGTAPFSPLSVEDADIRKEYLRLKFDYYLIAGFNQNEVYNSIF
jgi:hypothetical protein